MRASYGAGSSGPVADCWCIDISNGGVAAYPMTIGVANVDPTCASYAARGVGGAVAEPVISCSSSGGKSVVIGTYGDRGDIQQ
jgi:hypothetical protein